MSLILMERLCRLLPAESFLNSFGQVAAIPSKRRMFFAVSVMVLEGVRGKQNLVSVGVLYVGAQSGLGSAPLIFGQRHPASADVVSAGELFKKVLKTRACPAVV